jgi:cytoskeletal protein RodZ
VVSENLERSKHLFWLGRFFLALIAILLPIVSCFVTALLVQGHAKEEYFEAVSQILPVLLLALAIEQRYFTRRQSIPDLPSQLEFAEKEAEKLSRWYGISARIYALMVLLVLGLGEWIAVEVLATGQSSEDNLKFTAGSLAAGFTALIVSALVGTKQTAD